MVMQLFQNVVFFRHRLQLDHRHVATLREIAFLIKHIGDAARHARREIAPRLPDHDNHAAGHIFAAVVAHTFDNRNRTGVAHGETLARNAAEIALAFKRAVEHRIADDDRILGDDARVFRRAHHDAAT